MTEKFKHSIIVVCDTEMVHFCGYPEKPTEADIAALKKELETDEEFGLIGKELEFQEGPPELTEWINTLNKRRKLSG